MATSRAWLSVHQVVRVLGARQFSVSSPTCEKLIKPAIQIYGIGGKYAHALYSAASRKNSLDKVEQELNQVKDLMKKDVLLTAYMKDPTFSKKDKQGDETIVMKSPDSVIEKALKDKKYSDLIVNLFGALAENSRLPEVEDVISAFDRLMGSHRGEVPCTITSAKALDQATLKELNTALQGFVKKGESLKVDTKIDESLIGGVVLDIGEYHIDMSIATKIKKVSGAIRDAL